MSHHDFAFTRAYRLSGLPFGVTPGTTGADVDQGVLRVRFGPWRLRTEVANVEGVEESGDYAFIKTAGPAHLSLADRGITFATNSAQGLCIRFVDRVRIDLPVGHLRCPAATLTVADPAALRSDLLG
ncbi:MAG TPA: hypothetical protein VFO49_05785 [Nocardioides sp.]|nr:hypothetical protein [Nocardioides sp.]